jgi:8-oxo-dGTP diphosphatase
MASKPIQAAGGIVVRGGARVRIAVVQRSKDERWVLPRGKLKRDENPAAGARREAVEETGHRVKVREFLGAITYRARGRPKVVQFWHMQAAARPSRDVMKDIVAVEWLPLAAAVRRLSYPLEKLFLHHVGRRALKRRRRKPARRKPARRKPARRKSAGKTARKTARKPVKSRKLRRRARQKTAARPMRKKRRLASSRHPARSTQPGIFRRMFGRG